MGKAARCSVVMLSALLLIGYGASEATTIGPRGLEVNAGLVSPEDDIGSTFILGALMDLGEIVPSLALEGGVDFWTKSYDFGMYGSTSEFRYTNIGILGGVRYDFPVPGTITPFGFGALGLHVARASGEYSYTDPFSGTMMTEDNSATEMEFGIRFGGGAAVAVSPGVDFVARLGYDINGGANYFFVTGGARFGLGQ